MEVQDIDPKNLKPYSLNAKKHPPEQIEKIIRSINLSGFDQPIVVNKEGKDLVLIKGHGRLLASLQMGLETVPTVVLELPKLVADQARLMDNKSAESDYDVEVLVKELSKFNADQIIDTGFSADDLQGMIMQLENSIDFGSIDDSEDDRNDESVEDENVEITRVSLQERFIIPPFSLFDTRQGYWQKRKKEWIGLGIISELGRGDMLIQNGGDGQESTLLNGLK